MKRSRQTINFPPILYPKRSYSRKLISKTAKFPICALRCMSPYCHSIHIATHRLTIACKQNRKNIVQEVPLSESNPGFTPHDFPHRNEAICMYYSDIDEDDLDGLPSILTPAMAAALWQTVRLSDGRSMAHPQKRPAGLFTAGRKCDPLRKKLYAVSTPHTAFVLSCLRQALCLLCSTHRYNRGTGNKNRYYSPRWRRQSRKYRLPSGIL